MMFLPARTTAMLMIAVGGAAVPCSADMRVGTLANQAGNLVKARASAVGVRLEAFGITPDISLSTQDTALPPVAHWNVYATQELLAKGATLTLTFELKGKETAVDMAHVELGLDASNNPKMDRVSWNRANYPDNVDPGKAPFDSIGGWMREYAYGSFFVDEPAPVLTRSEGKGFTVTTYEMLCYPGMAFVYEPEPGLAKPEEKDDTAGSKVEGEAELSTHAKPQGTGAPKPAAAGDSSEHRPAARAGAVESKGTHAAASAGM